MTTLDRLIAVYTNFNIAEGLNLGSADEHILDEDLTHEQREWLKRFVAVWERATDRWLGHG